MNLICEIKHSTQQIFAMVNSYTQIAVDNQGVNLTYYIGIQMFCFERHFFNPISADAALSTKAENKSQTHVS